MTRHCGRVVTLTANPSLDRTLDAARPAGARQRRPAGRQHAPSPAARGSTSPARSPPPAPTSSRVLPAADDDPIVRALRGAGPAAGHRAGDRRRSAPTTRSPSPTARRPSSTSPAPPLDEDGPRRALPPRSARARRRCPLGGAVAVRCPRAPRSTGTPTWSAPSARHRRPDRRRHLRGPAARAAGRRPGRRAGPAQAQHRGARPAGRRRRGRGRRATRTPPWPPSRTLHERGVGEVLLTLGADGALLSTADGELWSARPPRDHRAQHRRRRRLQPGRLPARRPGRRPAGRPAAHRRRLRGGRRASLPGSAVPTPAQVDGAAVRVTAGLPGGSHRTAVTTAPRPGRRPRRPLNLREPSHVRTHHHRPGRARRRPGRRQEQPSSAGWPSWSPPPAGPPAPTACTPTPWTARPGRHRAARRHRDPALPVRRGDRGLAGLRPAAPRRSTSAPRTARPTWSSSSPRRPHGDADHLTLLTALARALVRPEFVASLRAAGLRRRRSSPWSRTSSPRRRPRPPAAGRHGRTGRRPRPPRRPRPDASSWSAPARPASRTPTWPPTSSPPPRETRRRPARGDPGLLGLHPARPVGHPRGRRGHLRRRRRACKDQEPVRRQAARAVAAPSGPSTSPR